MRYRRRQIYREVEEAQVLGPPIGTSSERGPNYLVACFCKHCKSELFSPHLVKKNAVSFHADFPSGTCPPVWGGTEGTRGIWGIWPRGSEVRDITGFVFFALYLGRWQSLLCIIIFTLALSMWKWHPGILLLLMVPTHLALWHSGAGPKIISDWRLSCGTWHWETCG